MLYQIEVTKEDSSRFVPYGKEHKTPKEAQKQALSVLKDKTNSKVTEARIVNLETGELVSLK